MPTNIIIPVASGKGGVGKTFLTANLSLAIAENEYETIAVDLDLGNSNLHSFLGLSNDHRGIGDFLRSQADSLEQFRVETEIPNLSYIAGDGRMPLMADITYHQKQKIIKEIKNLEADYIFLDLGAGSHNDILDIFGIADRGLLVTAPEPPSVRSMLVFLKNYLLRLLDRLVKRELKIIPVLQDIYKQPTDGPLRTLKVYRDIINNISPEIASEIDYFCKLTRPRFIYNIGDHPQDLDILPRIDNTLKRVFSMEGDHLGFIFRDSSVRSSIRAGKSLIMHSPNGSAAKSIRQIATRIIKAWDIDILESARRLTEHTTMIYEKMVMEEKLYAQ
jgi:flagellar biosynthesis protein FlhG